MQDRLRHLEILVKELAAKSAVAEVDLTSNRSVAGGHSTAIQDLIPVNGEPSIHAADARRCPRTGRQPTTGQVVLGKNSTTFVESTHWSAILNDIEDVKLYFEDEDKDEVKDDHETTASLLLNMDTNITKESLIAALPERPTCDRLIARYFRSNDPALHVIHRPTFQQEYREFCSDPTCKPTVWLGLLYAILCLATCFNSRTVELPIETRAPRAALIEMYQKCSAQCLSLSNYMKPGMYTLEAFILHSQSEIVQHGLVKSESWVAHGIAIRLALKMGLHRDAKSHPNLSVFQGEMRRRIWLFLCQVDLLLSFNLGLPPMVRGIQADTSIRKSILPLLSFTSNRYPLNSMIDS